MKINDMVLHTPKAKPEGGSAAAARAAGGASSPLEEGRLVRGRVLSFTPGGRAVLEVSGERVEARSSVPLTPGREFWFEVRQGGDQPRLALADKKGGIYRFLQQASGGLRDLNRLGALLATLQQWPAAGAASGPPSGLAADLAPLMAKLALGREPAPEKLVRMVAELRPGSLRPAAGAASFPRVPAPPGGGPAKPLSLPEQLQALARLAGTAGAAPKESEALAGLGRIGGMLEAIVGMNEQPPAPQQAPFWLLPFFFALDAGAGSWLLSLDQEPAAGEEAYSLAFFLEMSRLGEMQLQVRQRGGRLEGDFFLADPAAAAFLRGRLGELRERLVALGYQPLFRCRTGAGPMLPALKEALEGAAGSACRKLIDVTA